MPDWPRTGAPAAGSGGTDLTGAAEGRASGHREDVAVLARGASLTVFGGFLGRMLQMGVQVALARLLTPSALGIYAIGWSLLRISRIFSPLGLENGVVYFGRRYWHDDPPRLKGVLVGSLAVVVVSGLVSACLLYLAAPWIAVEVFAKPRLATVLRVFAPAFAFFPLIAVGAALTRVSKRMQFTVWGRDLMRPLLNLILLFVCYVVGWQLVGAVAACVVSFALVAALAAYYGSIVFLHATKEATKAVLNIRELLSFSVPASLAVASTGLLPRVDRLIVGYFRSAAEVGIYHVAAQTSILVSINFLAFSTIMGPLIADLHATGRKERLNSLVKVGAKWSLYISAPIFILMVLAPRDVIGFIYGREYEAGSTALIILASGRLLNVASAFAGVTLILTGYQNRMVAISSGALTCSLVMNFVLVPRLGLVGGALATATATALMSMAALLEVRRAVGVWPYDRRCWKGVAAASVSVVGILLIRPASIHPAAVACALYLLVSAVGFGIVLLMLGLDPEDYELVRILRMRGRT